MSKNRTLPRLVMVTPALAAANNGNWQTTRRWAAFLRGHAQVSLTMQWDGQAFDAMIALHARRSADSLHAFAVSGRPAALILTGTDLYRDIRSDPLAQRSLQLATQLVVLQPEGLHELSAPLQRKTRVIYQSAPALTRKPARRRTWDLALVGHLRDEKDPLTAARALARLGDPDYRLLQIGDAKDASTGAAFAQLAQADARIIRLGALPHRRTRQWISRSRLLLLPSLMEGGANVLIEAVTCGVAVLASRISGSIGMLGEAYAGYFPVGDDAALAALIQRCRAEPAFLQQLNRHCSQRATLFDPQLEAAAVRRLVNDLLQR